MGVRREGDGSRSPTYNGGVVDQHTTDRKFAMYRLKPRNDDWATTRIYFVHVSSQN